MGNAHLPPQSEEIPWLGGCKSYRFHKIQPRLIPWPGTAVCLAFSARLFPRQFLAPQLPQKGTLRQRHLAEHGWGCSVPRIPIPQLLTIPGAQPDPPAPAHMQHPPDTPRKRWSTGKHFIEIVKAAGLGVRCVLRVCSHSNILGTF